MIRLVDGTLGPLLVFLADWSIRWGVLILGLAAWFRVQPPRRAATRHLLGVTTLLAGLFLPLAPTWTAPWPWVRLGSGSSGPPPLTARAIEPPPRIARAVEPVPAMGPNPVEPPPTAPAVVQVNRSKPDHKAGERLGMGRMAWLGLGTAWLVGATWFLIRLVVGQVVLARLRRSARPITGPSRAVFEAARRAASLAGRRVEVATHISVGSPVVLGGRRATVLVPEDWDQWGAAAQRACLLHELAHLDRRDDGWKLRAELARVPFWFHPGVAWLQARLDREAELACDEATVALGVPPVELARLLLNCARQPHRLHPRAFPISRPALSFFGRETVSARITRLLEDTMPLALIRPSRLQMFGLIASVAALALAIGGARVAAIEPTGPSFSSDPQTPRAVSQQAPVATTPAAPSSSISVVVNNEQGQPIEGATVVIGEFGQSPDHSFAQTNAYGLAQIDRQPRPRDLILGFKKGYCYGGANLTAPKVDGRIALSLAGPRSLAGIVVDDKGHPVAGAAVRVDQTVVRRANQTMFSVVKWGVAGTPVEQAILARTNQDGRFRFDLLPDVDEVILVTSAEGKATTHQSSRTSRSSAKNPDEARERIILKPEARVWGRIVSRLPEVPVAGRSVLLQGEMKTPDGAFDAQSSTLAGTGITDDAGRFEIRGLGEGRAGSSSTMCLPTVLGLFARLMRSASCRRRPPWPRSNWWRERLCRGRSPRRMGNQSRKFGSTFMVPETWEQAPPRS